MSAIRKGPTVSSSVSKPSNISTRYPKHISPFFSRLCFLKEKYTSSFPFLSLIKLNLLYQCPFSLNLYSTPKCFPNPSACLPALFSLLLNHFFFFWSPSIIHLGIIIWFLWIHYFSLGKILVWSPSLFRGEESACSVEDGRGMGSIPKSQRFHGEENSSLLQYSCLGNSMDRRIWCAPVHGVAKKWTWLRMHTY